MAIHSTKLDCRKCSKNKQTILGCETDVEPYKIADIEVRRCPRKLITPETNIYLSVYGSLKSLGGYVNSGGLFHQSGKFVQICNIITAEFNRLERLELEEARKKRR